MTVLSKQKVLLTEQEIEEQDEEIDITTIDDAIPGLNWEQGFATLLSENDLFRMGHYRLYKHELLRNAFKENNDLLAFADYFDEKNCEKLNECADMIWENICDRTDEMDKLMKIATEREPQLLKKINKEIKGESLKYYVKFFVGVPTKMDMIVKTLEPIPICERLNDTVYEHIVTRVRKFMANGLYDEASCYMMRSLPHVHRVGFDDGEWYFDFMEACQYDSANRTIPEFVDPDHKMRAEIHHVKCRLSCDKIDGSNAELSTMIQFVEPSEEVNQEFRPQELYLDHRQKVIDKIGKIDDPDPLELRQYQEELVEMACSGKNTIICAPTGSGKTIVATYVIIDHLQKKRNNNEAARK